MILLDRREPQSTMSHGVVVHVFQQQCDIKNPRQPSSDVLGRFRLWQFVFEINDAACIYAKHSELHKTGLGIVELHVSLSSSK